MDPTAYYVITYIVQLTGEIKTFTVHDHTLYVNPNSLDTGSLKLRHDFL